MLTWIKGLAVAQRIALAVIAALIIIGAVWFVYDLFTASDKVKARIGANQTEAAVISGADAVNTTGDQSKTEAARTTKTEDMKNEVNKAEDAAGAHTAGANFLCDNFGICAEK